MTHVREHRSILAAAEKRLLIFIAERLPPAINSDHLTSLALAAMALAGGAFAAARWDRRAFHAPRISARGVPAFAQDNRRSGALLSGCSTSAARSPPPDFSRHSSFLYYATRPRLRWPNRGSTIFLLRFR